MGRPRPLRDQHGPEARWSSGCCQRDAVESPTREDLFEVGTYASIISVMQTNADRFQVMVKGLALASVSG